MLGLREAFDVVYGSSGGASNGAYFVAEQAAYGTTIYYDHINSSEFIDLWRPLRNKPVVDFHFVTDRIMVEPVILDWKVVIESPIPLKVLATSVENGDVEALENFQSQQELLHALHASARIPLVSGGNPFEYRGKSFWDSGIVDPFAIKSALRDNCTHVLVLQSRPRGLPLRHLSLIERTFILRHIARRSETLSRQFRSRFDPHQNGFALLEKSLRCPEYQPWLFGIGIPPTGPNISRMEKKCDRLVSGASAGVQAISATFGVEVSLVVGDLSTIDQKGHRIGHIGTRSITKDP